MYFETSKHNMYVDTGSLDIEYTDATDLATVNESMMRSQYKCHWYNKIDCLVLSGYNGLTYYLGLLFYEEGLMHIYIPIFSLAGLQSIFMILFYGFGYCYNHLQYMFVVLHTFIELFINLPLLCVFMYFLLEYKVKSDYEWIIMIICGEIIIITIIFIYKIIVARWMKLQGYLEFKWCHILIYFLLNPIGMFTFGIIYHFKINDTISLDNFEKLFSFILLIIGSTFICCCPIITLCHCICVRHES